MFFRIRCIEEECRIEIETLHVNIFRLWCSNNWVYLYDKIMIIFFFLLYFSDEIVIL